MTDPRLAAEYLRLNGIQTPTGVTVPRSTEEGEDLETSLQLTKSTTDVKSYAQIEDEYAAAAEAAGVKETEETKATTATTAATGASSEEIQEEIDKLKEEKEENIKKMEEIEDHIEELAKEAEEQIAAAAAAQEDAVKGHEEEVKQVVDENLQAYIEANKEGGEGMTRDELQQNIAGAMPDLPQVAEVVAALTAASELVDEIDSCLGELNKLISDTKAIDDLIEVKEGEYEAAVQAEQAAKCCDPIGFTVGEGADQAQYDFIVDDGAFDSTSDFLGSKNQWADMAALDTSGDGIVDAEELKAGNIKAVKTDAKGNQSIVDLADEFGADFSIDLNSYKQGGSHSAVDTKSDADADGVKDQTLLGTFNVNIGGQAVSGYNTLDDVDWLNDNYGLTSETQADNEDLSAYSADLQPHVQFYNFYTELSAQYRQEIEQGFQNIGVNEDQMKALEETTKAKADENAKNFFASIGLNEDQMTEENTNAENGVQTSEEEEDKKREEELLLQQAA